MATLQYYIFSQDKGAVDILVEMMDEILDQHSHLCLVISGAVPCPQPFLSWTLSAMWLFLMS